MLSEDEAREYAEAVAMVARHYDVGASAKTLDWINLSTTVASIYGVRIIGITARRKAERSGRRPGPGHNGGPAMNGHDPAPPAEAPAADETSAVDFSLMTGPGRPN